MHKLVVTEQPSSTLAKSGGQRFALIDAIKGVAACIIVWHHMSVYSPSSDLADQFAPNLMYALYNYGLFVVHLFLVFGGFALTMAIPDHPISWRDAIASFCMRYVRLAAPYVVMLIVLVSVARSEFGTQIEPPLIETFSWWHLFAHLFFAQDLLGFGNLSAGTWYLCIDIQYVALFLGIKALLPQLGKLLGRDLSSPAAMSAVLIPLGMVSTWYWNRVQTGEVWVFYFLGSLVLGSLVGWVFKKQLPSSALVVYALLMAASLVIEFRPRLIVALAASGLLYAALLFGSQLSVPRILRFLGRVSYSLFLIHYLVIAIVLDQLDPWIGSSPARAFAGMFVAFLASLLAATLLYLGLEAPCHQWLKAFSRRSAARASRPPAAPC